MQSFRDAQQLQRWGLSYAVVHVADEGLVRSTLALGSVYGSELRGRTWHEPGRGYIEGILSPGF